MRCGSSPRRQVRHSLVLEMRQQLGQTMLDRLEMVEPGAGDLQLRHQLADPLLEMADPRMVGEGKLEPVDFLHQSLDHAFEVIRRVLAALIVRFERIGEHRDALLQRERIHRKAPPDRLCGERAHLVGEVRRASFEAT